MISYNVWRVVYWDDIRSVDWSLSWKEEQVNKMLGVFLSLLRTHNFVDVDDDLEKNARLLFFSLSLSLFYALLSIWRVVAKLQSRVFA